MHAKQPFSEKKEYINALDKEIPIVTELVVVGDLCAFVASAGRFKIGRVMQFVKYDKNNKELQYEGNYANIVGKFGVLCTWYKASDDQFVYTMSSTSCLDYQPLNSHTYVHLLLAVFSRICLTVQSKATTLASSHPSSVQRNSSYSRKMLFNTYQHY